MTTWESDLANSLPPPPLRIERNRILGVLPSFFLFLWKLISIELALIGRHGAMPDQRKTVASIEEWNSMRPVDKECLADQGLSFDSMTVRCVSNLIRPKAAVLAARTIVPHYKELIGLELPELHFLRIVLVNIAPLLRIDQGLSQP